MTALSNDMITREFATLLVNRYRPDIFLIGGPIPLKRTWCSNDLNIPRIFNQHVVDIKITHDKLELSLDDFSNELLLPMAQELAIKIRAQHGRVTYDLTIPPDMKCTRNRYDGLSVRCIWQEFSPQQWEELPGVWKTLPGGWHIRFDVAHSVI